MKKILLGALIAMTCFQTVDAQRDNRNARQHQVNPEKIVQRMDRALDLSDKQEKDLTALYTDYYKSFETNTKDKKVSREDRKTYREERRNQRAELQKKINAILTPEQQTKWAEIKKAQADKRKAKLEKQN